MAADGKWLMVDLGMTFADPDYPGSNWSLPISNSSRTARKDLLGVVLTHAHEDHIGAVPYFAEDLGVPLYATPFTARLVRGKLEEAGLLDRQVELNVIDHLDPVRRLARSASAMCRWRTRLPRATRC
jgi:ribonuclease J